MLSKILIGLGVIIAGILIFASTKPDTFHYERSMVINAPAEKIFPMVNDMKVWLSWSPYEKADPAMKRELSPNTSGVGAFYNWDGNSDAGAGHAEITKSVPSSFVEMTIAMKKPFEATNTASLQLIPEGTGTKVVWAIDGKTNLISKVFSTFVDCEKMIGDQFTEGLTSLKALAEK